MCITETASVRLSYGTAVAPIIPWCIVFCVLRLTAWTAPVRPYLHPTLLLLQCRFLLDGRYRALCPVFQTLEMIGGAASAT